MPAFLPNTPITLSPIVRRIVATNAGAMTGPGTNTYLVGGDAVAVIDPGPDEAEHIEAIVDACGARRIGWILLTHFHADHAPGAARLAQVTGAPVYAHTTDEPSVRVDHALADGDAIGGAEFTLDALHTPGHAAHHLCFHLREEQALFTGDTVLDGMTSVVAPDGGDMAAYLASLDRIATLTLDRIYPGHGDVIADPIERVRAYAAHRRDRERMVLAQVTAGPCTIAELVGAVYPGLDVALVPVAHWQVHAHLIKLRDEGVVDGDDPRGRWRAR